MCTSETFKLGQETEIRETENNNIKDITTLQLNIAV